MAEPPTGKVVFFDGECGLCHRLVRFMLRHDRNKEFCYAPQQGEYGRKIGSQFGLSSDQSDTVWLLLDAELPGERLLIRSDASLEILRNLPSYKWTWFLLAWWPRPLREAVYRLISRNRLRFFGKAEYCSLPKPGQTGLFLD